MKTATSLIRPQGSRELEMDIKRKFRARRAYRQYERALVSASPAMRSELLAMAAHQNYHGQQKSYSA
jgi:hypothetical protein